MASNSLIASLESVVPGGILSEIFDRRAIASDASHYLLTPSVVVQPENGFQVGEIFRISQEENVGLTFRSGGTSLSGQGVSSGILVDTRRNFKQIEVLDNGARVRVQPGATVKQVNIALAKFGRKLGPDPASEIACTIGGVVANNSSGMACGTEFNTYATLDSLTMVLPSGTVINTKKVDADEHFRLSEPILYAGIARLRDRILQNPYSIEKIKSLYSIKNTMGYSLNSFLDYSKPVDILAHLIVGSEGTLAFIAEVTFCTVPLLKECATGLLIFENLAEATTSLPALKATKAAVIELLDNSSLLVAQSEHMADSVLGGFDFKEHAALLVEYQAQDGNELAEQISTAQRVISSFHLDSAELSQEVKVRNELWHARKGLYAAVAGNRPSGTSAILEDIAVPMNALHETTMQLRLLLNKHKYEGSVIFGHAKDGNLHFLLNERFDRPDLIRRYQDFTEDMVSLVLGNNGSLKAEHGTGRIMAPYVRRQVGDELYEVMVSLKKLCDPRNLLNPGVLISENRLVHIENLKINPSVDAEIDRCVECGYCEPVCPSHDITMTPRQRIVIRRAVADAKKAGDEKLYVELTSRYIYDGIQTCAVDSMCAVSCPVHIDTGALVTRLRAENHGKQTQKLGSLAARSWSPVTSILSLLLSAAKNSPPTLISSINGGLRKILGSDALPLWNKDLPSGGKKRSSVVNNQAEALYFPSCINSIFGSNQGAMGVQSAFMQLCARAGIEIMVPKGIASLCCGTPWKSKGLTEGYNRMSTRNLSILQLYSLPVISDSTSCTEGLMELTKGADLRVVDALEFIAERVLPALTIKEKISSIALHPTCSGVQMGLNAKMSLIAHAVAQEVFIPENWACCGFAGDRGLLHPELTTAATAAEAQELSTRVFSAYASSNRPCEIAMSQATGKSYIHLLEILEQVSRP
ncbi:MAG: FAD-binding and (Fe-S)-binding domain-containing protein [Candidatus Planktophila sp.]|nr:FAD-binding and (Fe-S)-binding domain-containing protein [Candidatus Planktophila sp.]